MHAESILTPCQKVYYNYSKNNTPPYTICTSVALSYNKGVTFILKVYAYLILCSPSVIISITLPARKRGLVQKDLESTLACINLMHRMVYLTKNIISSVYSITLDDCGFNEVNELSRHVSLWA